MDSTINHSLSNNLTLNVSSFLRYNDEVDTADDTEHDTTELPYGLIIVLCITSIITVVINIPSIVLLLKTKIGSSNINTMHLLSLGVADALVGVASFTVGAMDYFANRPTIQYRHCLARYLFLIAVYVNSILQLLAICISRVYFMIKLRPLFVTGKSLARVMLITIFATLLNVGLACMMTIHKDHNKLLGRCILDSVFDIAFLAYWFGIEFILIEIMVITFFFYFIKTLLKHKKQLKLANYSTCPHKSREIKAIKILIGVVVLFILCVTPYHIMVLKLETSSISSRRWCMAIATLNSTINPIVYVFMVPGIRAKISLWLCCDAKQLRT